MDNLLSEIKKKVYDKCSCELSEYEIELESQEYGACKFELDKSKIISRNSKITPKKIGQFVTFWKRGLDGSTMPFEQSDSFDFFVINVASQQQLGQFVFPKKVLIQKGIISTNQKEGKRGFRVYPKWDVPQNKQATKSQLWQLQYFYEINDSTDIKEVLELYRIKP